MRKKSYKSIEDFKVDQERINDLIHGLQFRIKFFSKAPSSSQFEHVDWKQMFEKYKNILEFDEKQIDNVYELGFIRLYASFESFMYEFIKELYTKYPNALPLDRKVQVGDILEWKTEKSIREYILDHIAIENSYDLITWEKTLKNSFGIDVFTSLEQKKSFEILNLFRNMAMHSGGKFNSKIERDARKFLAIYNGKNETPKKVKSLFEVSKMEISYERLFYLMSKVSTEIVDSIKTNIA